MFLKPFRVKSSSQMKGSDKKKFKAEVRKRFGYFTDPDVDQDALNDLIPNKEELTATKIETFDGIALLLYANSNKKTVFFEFEKAKLIFPSLWTLWQHPNLLPTMTTHAPVVSKMANGADLMLPGIVINEELGDKAYGKIEKDQILSVNLTKNKAPVAIGMAHLSSEDMYMSGKRGKALIIKHCIGDFLWQHDGKMPLPELGVPENLDFLKEDSEFEEIDPEEAMTEEVSEEKLEDFEIVEVAEQLEEIEIDPDQALEEAFLRACKLMPKKAEFPILTSNFFRVHVIPNSTVPNLDIKKTKWKKVGKFLSEKQSQGFLTIKEEKKGIETITNINREHPQIVEFKATPISRPENSPNEAKNGYQPPVINELYIVTGNEVALFFKEVGVPKGTGLSPQDVRELIRKYVAKNDMQNKDDPKLINLDPILAQAALVKGENDLTIKWDKITSRITNKMSKGYSIQFSNQEIPSVHKGKLEMIEMIVGSRSGNKKVTLIHNLDVYGIDPQEFAHKCQVGVAASSTINEAANKKRSNGAPVIEVLVQGNQVAFAGKLLLEEYKIPKKYIRGLELAAKKGKK